MNDCGMVLVIGLGKDEQADFRRVKPRFFKDKPD